MRRHSLWVAFVWSANAMLACATNRTVASLERLSLADRCRLAESVATFTHERSPDFTPDPVANGACANSLASSEGRRLVRVEIEVKKGAQSSYESLFRATETCPWKELELVTEPWERVPDSVGAVVVVAFYPDRARDKGIPFEVGVEPRPAGDGSIALSPCGVDSGHIEYRGGVWRAQP